MTIKFKSINSYSPLTVTKQGDALTVNGIEYDFTALPDGATLPSEAIDCDYIVGDIERVNGVIEITLLAPYHQADKSNLDLVGITDALDGVIL